MQPAALSSSGAAVVNSSAMPPAGVSSGWVVSDRPKSAAGTALGPTGAPMTSGNGNGAAMVRVNSNSTGGNSLSYGTIKNRFLSSTGGAGGGNAASGKPEYGAAIGSGGSAGGGKVSGKMYGR